MPRRVIISLYNGEERLIASSSDELINGDSRAWYMKTLNDFRIRVECNDCGKPQTYTQKCCACGKTLVLCEFDYDYTKC